MPKFKINRERLRATELYRKDKKQAAQVARELESKINTLLIDIQQTLLDSLDHLHQYPAELDTLLKDCLDERADRSWALPKDLLVAALLREAWNYAPPGAAIDLGLVKGAPRTRNIRSSLTRIGRLRRQLY